MTDSQQNQPAKPRPLETSVISVTDQREEMDDLWTICEVKIRAEPQTDEEVFDMRVMCFPQPLAPPLSPLQMDQVQQGGNPAQRDPDFPSDNTRWRAIDVADVDCHADPSTVAVVTVWQQMDGAVRREAGLHQFTPNCSGCTPVEGAPVMADSIEGAPAGDQDILAGWRKYTLTLTNPNRGNRLLDSKGEPLRASRAKLFTGEIDWKPLPAGPAIRHPQGKLRSASELFAFPGYPEYSLLVFQAGNSAYTQVITSVSQTEANDREIDLLPGEDLYLQVNGIRGQYEDHAGTIEVWVKVVE